MKKEVYHIDAQDKVVGRLATEIAVLLRGKQKADYQPHILSSDEVVVKNVDKMKITGQKRDQKMFYRHSGYPGGLKSISLGELMKKDPARVLKLAVWNMLPKNRLRAQLIKHLKFE